MNETMTIIQQRRTIRAYQDKAIDTPKKTTLNPKVLVRGCCSSINRLF